MKMIVLGKWECGNLLCSNSLSCSPSFILFCGSGGALTYKPSYHWTALFSCSNAEQRRLPHGHKPPPLLSAGRSDACDQSRWKVEPDIAQWQFHGPVALSPGPPVGSIAKFRMRSRTWNVSASFLIGAFPAAKNALKMIKGWG